VPVITQINGLKLCIAVVPAGHCLFVFAERLASVDWHGLL
jgi:hypothetical protein